MENRAGKEKIKYLAKLKQKKFRSFYQEIVIEGRNTIEQLLESGIKPKEIIAQDALPWDPSAIGVPISVVTEQDMSRICDTQSPSDVCGLYRVPTETMVDFHRALYLDGISDPGNMGTIIRSALSFGIEQIILSETCCEYFAPKTIRASLGACFLIPVCTRNAEWLAESGCELIVADSHKGVPLKQFRPRFDKRTVIVIGSEAKGISAEVQSLKASKVLIEMLPAMESLNASVAAGIILWWFWVHTNDCI